jgi:hypothetical protein
LKMNQNIHLLKGTEQVCTCVFCTIKFDGLVLVYGV